MKLLCREKATENSCPDGRARKVARSIGRLFLLAILLIPFSALEAQQASGRLIGRVVSGQTGEPIPSAQVMIEGTSQGTLSDVGGRFVLLNVPVGEHAIVVQTLGYGAKTVTGVNIAAGQPTSLDISLLPQAVALEGITVSAQRERGATSALLSQRQKAAVVVDAIGAEQISRTPDSDAASALKRVPGVSVVDGKFVYVRGLGERYGATTLNGAPLPSPLPDKKAVPLDLIPSNLLESIVTAKTYSPEHPGDYAGGLVQLETRNYPAREQLRVTTSVGFEANTSLSSGLRSTSGLSALGFGDPVGLPNGIGRGEPVSLPSDPARQQAFVNSLGGGWAPVQRDQVPVNYSAGITYGNQLEVAGKRLGFIATGSYAQSFSTTNDLLERYYAVGDGPVLQVDYDGNATTQSVAMGGLINTSLSLTDASRVSLNAVYNRLVDDEARNLGGLFESQGPYVNVPRLRYVANDLVSTQLKGEHLLSWLGGSTATWRAGYSKASRYEPNTRTVVYRSEEPSGSFTFFPGPSSGLVFHQELEDDGFNGAADLKLPFTLRSLPASLAVGGAADLRDRSVYTRRFRLVPNNGGLDLATQKLPPNELFSARRIGSGSGQLGVTESTFREDNYDADQSVLAAYAMFDAELLPRLRVVAGARAEQATQNVAVRDLFDTPLDPLAPAELDNFDLLPAVNLTYGLSDAMNLRAAASQTVARPQFRELTPFLFADYYGGLVTRGNPFLERSRIFNGDVRWEWFFRAGALISASGFFKSFDKPIEPFALVLGSSPGATWVNTEGADLYGIELEFRSSLGFLTPLLENLALDANLTLAESMVRGDSVVLYNPSSGNPLPLETSGDQDRPLFGQSPYTLNLGLTYDLQATGTSATLLFNRFGRRLDAFGGASLPDIYEDGRSQLDFVLEQPIWYGMELKLAASRLLGGDVTFEQTFPDGQTVTTRQYDLGRKLSIGIAWEPGNR